MTVQVILSARANAQPAGMSDNIDLYMDTSTLVVDELVILRGAYSRKPPVFRAKGGVNYPRFGRSHVYVRLRSVPGAEMKTIILKPWWERRYKHRGVDRHRLYEQSSTHEALV